MYTNSIEVLKILEKNGYKAFIVGGYPRDRYMNIESNDVDICTNASPKEIMKFFTNNIANEKYGEVTVFYNNIRFEITTFRRDLKYMNNRLPVKIKFVRSLKKDLIRRDFVINTLCINSKGDYVDLLGAKKDIKNKTIKCVGNVNKKIREDILRSLRAVRLATTLDFKMEPKLEKTIKKYNYLLQGLSYTRKKNELDKIFESKNSKKGIDLIKKLDLDNVLEITKIKYVINTRDYIGIWAQLDVLDIYPFTNKEKNMISKINKLMKKSEIDNYDIYTYGITICETVSTIKNLEINIEEIYEKLPIKGIRDVNIKASNICEILNRKPDSFIKQIYTDLEKLIVLGKLENDIQKIKEYIINNYNIVN